MSDPVLMDYDPLTASKTLLHETNDGKDWTFESLQDATEIVEANKILYNDTDERARFEPVMTRVASIPLNLAFQLHQQGILNDEKALLRWLDDPDNRFFRTRPGKLAKK